MTTTETELIRAAQEGKEPAWRALRAQYAPLIRSVLSRWMWEEGSQEDVEGAVWEKVWRTIGQADPLRPFGPWLTVVTRHTAIDWLRTHQRRVVTEPLVDNIEPLPTIPHTDEARQLLHVALAALPDEDRHLLTLRYFEGMPCQDLARQTGRRVGATKVALHRARIKLRDQLKALGYLR